MWHSAHCQYWPGAACSGTLVRMSRPSAILVAALGTIMLASVVGTADAGKRKRRQSNMPPGWSWPPTGVMQQTGKACLARLDDLGVRWRKAGKALKVATAVVIPDMKLGGIRIASIWRKPPFVMDCHLAAALAAQGPVLHELGVRELRFTSIHRYTHVQKADNKPGALSRHALGLAIDVWQMVDDEGVVHSVEDDYVGGDELLLAVERRMNDSGAFRMVLTPDNDPVGHDDHFHFEARVDYTEQRPAQTRSSPAKRQRAKRAAKQRAKRAARRRAAQQAKRRARHRQARQRAQR